MFNKTDFISCVVGELAKKGYGAKKSDEAITYFKRKSADHEAGGLSPSDAANRAMRDTFDEMTFRVNERAKVTRKNLSLVAENADRINAAMTVKTNLFKSIFHVGQDNRGSALGHALISTIENDPRFLGLNVSSTYRVKLGQYWAAMEAAIENFSKGAFGREKGVQHHQNVLHELYKPGSTGDTAAAEIAKAYREVQKLMLQDFNNAGGTIRELDQFIMPQRTSSVKIARSMPQWIDNVLQLGDWNKIRWPNGDQIPAGERQSFLEHVWRTLVSDGTTDIEPSVGHGQGRAVGNLLDNHRVLFFKDADSWLAYHNAYGDGSIFDVVASHIDAMAHKTAIITHYGRNPRLMAKTYIQQGAKAAGDFAAAATTKKDAKTRENFDAVASKYDKMLSLMLRENPMNAESPLAATVMGTSNLLTTALLGAVPLLSQTGDLATTMAVRLANHTPLTAGLGMYFKGVAPGGFKGLQKLALQTGFVHDSMIMPTFAAQRFSGLATYGPAWTKRVGDWGMRLSGLQRETDGLRTTTSLEQMGHLARDIEKPFDKLDNGAILQRYGIGPEDWDAVRKNVDLFEPRSGVFFLNPQDILKSNLANKEKLFVKFASMIDGESHAMVPGATTEAAVSLKGTTRPDTLPGALLHSFSMFKNYPMTIYAMYGRRALALENTGSRLKFLSALGIGLIASGAMGIQMRELSQLREPMDMTDKRFWYKAILASGGLSIWGDFLLGTSPGPSGTSFTDTAAGPLAGLANDMIDVTVGSAFKWADTMDTANPYGGKWASKLTEFARRYEPLASNWYLRPVLNREVFDQLQRFIDPQGARVRERATIARQEKNSGNAFIVPPGQHLFGQ